ncbi:hypothetical protein H4Q26_016115 [Puccinia striiformis f. sp. tritici PST-130]|nr:hypothetical protein H4Q26_016115 [Puccinia striiformis f. sp. tritici PST-130]
MLLKPSRLPVHLLPGKRFPTTPPAGLHVDGVGNIALPLREGQLRQLIAQSHQAPFGRRSQTVIDESVRKTWEINRNQLRFLNPAWQGYVLDLCKRVATSLGIDGPIRSELYKMLIYEKGAMFKPHTDTEKTLGMFGTLIICLPSAHTGGEVVVKHNGQCKTLPVQSGYRCVLTYNLAIQPDLPRPAASALGFQQELLRRTLKIWLRDLVTCDVESHLYYALEHEYTEAAMSLQALKAEDFARVQGIRDLTAELPFVVFLALLEKQEEGPVKQDWRGINCYHKRRRYQRDDGDANYDKVDDGRTHVIGYVIDTTHVVKSLHSLDGTIIANDFAFDMKMCIEEDPFLDINVTAEHFQPYTGNEPPIGTAAATLVIVPYESLGEYLSSCASDHEYQNINTHAALAYFGQMCTLGSVQKPLLDAINDLCRMDSSNHFSPAIQEDILKAALQHSHYELFQTVGERHKGKLPITFFDWAKEWLDGLPAADRVDKYHSWIPLLIRGYPSIATRLNAIESMSDPADYASVPQTEPRSAPWAAGLVRECIDMLFSATALPTEADASMVVSAIFKINDTWTKTSALLISIYDTCPAFGLAKAQEKSERAHFYPGEDALDIIAASSHWNSQTRPKVTPKALVQFACDLCDMSSTHARDLLQPFIEEISTCSTRFSADDMSKFWMPSLYQLIPALASRGVVLETTPYQNLTRELSVSWLRKTLRSCPEAGINTRSRQVNCSCADCDDLNEFLQDTCQDVIRFKHIERIGSPHTLVITKRHTLQQAIDKWERREKKLYADLANNIQPEHLVSLLGADDAVRIRWLAGLRRTSKRTSSMLLKISTLQGHSPRGALPATPPAGLHVDGVGDIAMPLTEEQVRQLIDKSHQAPFGRRSETLVDVSVRNTWEINGDQLRFLDPAWQSYLLDLSKRVAINLGIEGLIRLDLYKMLIYEKGAMFKPHTDTERTPGMFGTLIICLPSPHTGGEVVVKHNGECKTLRTSDAKQSFACWYSDVTHEVLPVTSGHRCVLTYNMAIKPGHTRPAASAIESQKEPLRKTLRYWLRDLEKNNSNDVPSYLYHALNHEYTEATMSLETLKAEDFARVQTLRDLADELPFEIFLTLLEKEESGTVEADWRSERSHKRGRYDYDDDDDDDGDGNSGHHDIDEICETNYKVKSLRALDGKTIASKYDFDMSFCTGKIPFRTWKSPGKIMNRTRVIVLAKYLAKCASNRTYCSNTTKPSFTIPWKIQQSNPPGTLSHALQASFQHSHFELLKTIAGLQQGHLPLSFFDWVKEWLNKLPLAERTEKYQTWHVLLGYHQQKLIASASSRRVSQSISDPIEQMKHPLAQARLGARLTRPMYQHLLESNAIPTSSDGSAIVAAVLSLNETSTNTSALLTSIFDRFPQVQATAFLLAFLAGLKKREAAAHFPTSENVELRKSFAPRVLISEDAASILPERRQGRALGQESTTEALKYAAAAAAARNSTHFSKIPLSVFVDSK